MNGWTRDADPAGDLAAAPSPAWRITLLGGFRIAGPDGAIGREAWRWQKAASLVKLLALAPGHRLGREEITELLWPDLDPGASANTFHQALHTARRVLASLGSPSRPTTGALHLRGGALTLRLPGGCWVDVEAFERAAETARRAADPERYRAALDLYTGDLLPEDRYEDWVAGRREALHQTYLDLLLALGNLEEARGAHAEALRAFGQAVAHEPTLEAGHVGLMRLYARTGQRPQVIRQYGRLCDVLRRELDAEPDAASQRLYQAILTRQFPPGGRAAAPPARPAGAPHNLPTPLTGLVGREREIAEIARLLAGAAAGGARLVTLMGTGGCGKSRLALAVATALAAAEPARYPDGVWLVELAAVRDPALVPAMVAAVLGAREEPQRPLLATLGDLLRERRLLLVLDNCEHLLDACADLVTALLGVAPELRVLATSRAALHVGGELTWRVPSLQLPDTPSTDPADLAGAEAVRLLVDRICLLDPAFKLTRRNAPAVAEICRRLDGIPLALELAAARAALLTVEQVAAGLDDVLGMLTRSTRTAPPRHQTLRATLDWSYGLLAAEERALLRRLAVFAGDTTLEAVEAVCAADTGADAPAGPLLEGLAALVDHSLVLVEAQEGQARYRLLETVRQYGEEQLRAQGEATATHRRHRDYFLALAAEAEAALQGPAPGAWLDRLEREHDNLRAALAWSLAADGEAGAALRLAGMIWRFWLTRGYAGEGRRWLARALAVPAGAASPAARAKALGAAGALAHSQGDYAATAALTAESLDLWRTLGDEAGVAGALGVLAMVHKARGDYAAAMRLFEEALALWRALGQDMKVSMTLNNLGATAYDQGDFARFEGYVTESLAIKRALGDRQGIAIALFNLGEAARSRGNYAQARELLAESLTHFRAQRSTPRIAHVLHSLGIVAHAQGDEAAAHTALSESLSMFRALGERGGIALCLEGLAMVEGAWGRDREAARLFGVADALRTRLGFPVAPVDRADYDRAVADVRARLDVGAFTAAWNAGQAAPPDEVVAEVLDGAAEPDR